MFCGVETYPEIPTITQLLMAHSRSTLCSQIRVIGWILIRGSGPRRFGSIMICCIKSWTISFSRSSIVKWGDNFRNVKFQKMDSEGERKVSAINGQGEWEITRDAPNAPSPTRLEVMCGRKMWMREKKRGREGEGRESARVSKSNPSTRKKTRNPSGAKCLCGWDRFKGKQT